MKKLLFAAIALWLSQAREANAQFGLSIVYDPTNYANALLRYSQLIAQLNQLRATYDQIVNQYNLALQMSRTCPIWRRDTPRFGLPGEIPLPKTCMETTSRGSTGLIWRLPNRRERLSQATNTLLT